MNVKAVYELPDGELYNAAATIACTGEWEPPTATLTPPLGGRRNGRGMGNLRGRLNRGGQTYRRLEPVPVGSDRR